MTYFCLFLVDEVVFSASMRLKEGRIPFGATNILTVSNIRSRNVSVCWAMYRYGILHKEINTRPYNKESFLGYREIYLRHIEFNNYKEVFSKWKGYVKSNKPENEEQLFSHTEVGQATDRGFQPWVREELLGGPPLYLGISVGTIAYKGLKPSELEVFSKWKGYVKSNKPENEEQLFRHTEVGQATDRGFQPWVREELLGGPPLYLGISVGTIAYKGLKPSELVATAEDRLMEKYCKPTSY
ncbi:hypothetical protein RF11_11239 [Thelohanellus kitauei]|uniref:Uncharacterized protein n=1 Tax=Thelohanellus kitauei TaxID=669202 RepID=A0A0C2INX1_THEKT|nr:hypothetical protein RF11_11239 [Thelohanellus kitauei]